MDEMLGVDRFFAFARARHEITLRRAAGLPRPEWTDDPILSRYRFTNVFREMDRTTVWIERHVRQEADTRLKNYFLDPTELEPWQRILAVVLARTFNRTETLEQIFCQDDVMYGQIAWSYVLGNQSVSNLESYMRAYCPRPWVTGAYIVKTPDGMDKLAGALWIVERARERLRALAADPSHTASMEALHADLVRFPYLGGFSAFEIVSDLRWMSVGRNWPDIMTWAHAGPGAVRGLNRVHGRPVKRGLSQRAALAEMRELLAASRHAGYWPQDWPSWEMREVEHTLCEHDKHERARLGQGTPRQLFR